MTTHDRLALIRRVLRTVETNTESFSEGTLGPDLAYLCLAISEQKADVVDWSPQRSNCAATLELFRNCFPPDDPVWHFIITSHPTICA